MGPPRVSTAQGGPDPLTRSALREDEIGSPTSAREDHVVFDPAGVPAGWGSGIGGQGLPQLFQGRG